MTARTSAGARAGSLFLTFGALLAGVYLLHLPLLRLPYFWDEAGYYVPAARDLWLTGSLIPHSTPSNAHPPLVMAYLAASWKVFGFSPLVTRSAMLVVAAFSLLGVYRLALRVANREVAWASTVCTTLYPVFFAQSSLAQVDLAAAGLTFWALEAYLDERAAGTAFWFTLAVLAKETAILAPLALLGWRFLSPWLTARFAVLRPQSEKLAGDSEISSASTSSEARPRRVMAALMVPLAVLVSWYGYHYLRTGYVFGNPEFFRYNVQATLSPLRIGLALITRWWQVSGYLHLFALTLLMGWAMLLPPLGNGGERPRIAIPVQCVFGVVVLAYVFAMAVIGGAVLARYMLPAVPLVIIVAASTLWRRVRVWPLLVGLVAAAFVAGWFMNPPYGFAPEDNLAYRDYIVLHQQAAQYLEEHATKGPVLTAWPGSDELSQPYLGYVERALPVVRIENFSADEVMAAAEERSRYQTAFLFSTKYEPRHPFLERWPWWQSVKQRFFGFHRDLPPAAAAQFLGGRVVFEDRREGQWVAVVELEHVYDAQEKRRSGCQQVAGMCLHDEPDRMAIAQLKRVARRQGQVHFEFGAAVDPGGHDHVMARQGNQAARKNIARTQAFRRVNGQQDIAGANANP
jgi:hypothetical protein